MQSSIIMACEIGIAVLHVRCLKLDLSLFGVLLFDNHDRKCAAWRQNARHKEECSHIMQKPSSF